jgi:hypothetical protein
MRARRALEKLAGIGAGEEIASWEEREIAIPPFLFGAMRRSAVHSRWSTNCGL